MADRLDHPEVLADFEAAPARRVRLWTGFGVAFWLLLLAGDWEARFRVFRWQDQWWPRRPPAASPAAAPAVSRSQIVPAQTGAGLTQMVPVPWVAARYAELHPEYASPRDGFGYHNEFGPGEKPYPVVMLGDSFLLSLGTQNVAQALAAIGGIDVYNHGMYGAGPFLEMRKFVGSGRFQPFPQVVVWNLSARELGAPLFLRQPVDYWFDQAPGSLDSAAAIPAARIRWDLLAPRELRKAWPNTSLEAYFGRRIWSQIKLLALREWPRDVLGAEDPAFGPMLFYRENLRMLPLLTPGENAAGIVQVAAKVAARFKERGAVLVVLLVPEKEQIHARALSPADQEALACGPQLLAEIESGLEKQGVPTVNLMPAFQEATARGTRLYWRDDTHWNDAGIRLAAEELWRTVEPLLEGKRESMSNIQHSTSNDQVSDR